MLFIRCEVFEKFFIMHDLEIFGERNVYLLNNCIIRVFYRFNRSMALHRSQKRDSRWHNGY